MGAVLSDLYGTVTLKEEQGTALKDFVFALNLTGFGRSLV